MRLDHDLFDTPLPSARPRPPGRRIGYAARPGTGPRGQRCNTCRHCVAVVQRGARARKCELNARIWTHDAATDVKHNAPACALWERKIYPQNQPSTHP